MRLGREAAHVLAAQAAVGARADGARAVAGGGGGGGRGRGRRGVACDLCTVQQAVRGGTDAAHVLAAQAAHRGPATGASTGSGGGARHGRAKLLAVALERQPHQGLAAQATRRLLLFLCALWGRGPQRRQPCQVLLLECPPRHHARMLRARQVRRLLSLCVKDAAHRAVEVLERRAGQDLVVRGVVVRGLAHGVDGVAAGRAGPGCGVVVVRSLGRQGNSAAQGGQ